MTTDHAVRLVHRPTDPLLLRQAAVELMHRGLTLADAAHAVGLSPVALDRLLAAEDDELPPGRCQACED